MEVMEDWLLLLQGRWREVVAVSPATEDGGLKSTCTGCCP